MRTEGYLLNHDREEGCTLASVIDSSIMQTRRVGNTLYGWTTHDQFAKTDKATLIERFTDGADTNDRWVSYESFDMYDVFFMNVPPELRDDDSLMHLGVYVTKEEVFVAYTKWDAKDKDFVQNILKQSPVRADSPHRLFLALIDFITKKDFVTIGRLEDEATELEDKVLAAKDADVQFKLGEISRIRKQLRPMKHLYEELLGALEELMEDENELFSENDNRPLS